MFSNNGTTDRQELHIELNILYHRFNSGFLKIVCAMFYGV
mgnify:CR=1 FL=1